MDFSAVIIAKNEEKTLPRLVNSLKGVDEILILDTGSTDNTAKLARELGCTVYEVGDRFIETPTKEDIELFKTRYGFEPTFTTDTKLFNYASARNHAMSLAKNDWCFQPDCDEIVDWDLPEIEKLLDNTDQLNYRFCFQHNPDGTCALEFMHTKFFKKSKLKWVKKVHEIHTPIDGDVNLTYTDKMYLHHWQIVSDNRANYLTKLEYSILETENDDRNTYYLGREYYWTGHYEKAIKLLTEAIKIGWWKPELGQAYIFIGDSYKALGQLDKAEEAYHKSIQMFDERREPFNALADFYEGLGNYEKAITYYLSAMGVSYKEQGYLNDKNLYGWRIPDRLAFLYGKLGNEEESKKWWLETLKHNPPREIIENGLKYFYELPKISIVVPTCRPEGFARLEKSIKENTVYPNYEIIKKDGEGTAIEKFNQGVEEGGDLIVFIADDCEVKQGWLEQAFVHLQEKLNGRGLVIFNDNHWNGTLANHFLVSKDMKDELDGEIWHSGYHHNSCDVELYCRLNAKKLLSYCKEAEIIHHHYFCTSNGEQANAKDDFYKKIESKSDKDRELLPKRLEALGLHEDAIKYQYWYDKLQSPEYPLVEECYDLRLKIANLGKGLKVLNIGAGDGESGLALQLPHFQFKQLDHLDIEDKYLEIAKGKTWKSENVNFIKGDMRDYDFSDYDLVLAFDVIEHIEKEDALRVIDGFKKALIFIPLEEEFRPNMTEEKSQDHLSFWTEEDFKQYKTELIKNFHRYNGKQWDALWVIK